MINYTWRKKANRIIFHVCLMGRKRHRSIWGMGKKMKLKVSNSIQLLVKMLAVKSTFKMGQRSTRKREFPTPSDIPTNLLPKGWSLGFSIVLSKPNRILNMLRNLCFKDICGNYCINYCINQGMHLKSNMYDCHSSS